MVREVAEMVGVAKTVARVWGRWGGREREREIEKLKREN